MAATYSSLVGLAVGGKYEVRRVLGAGGMGVVCEAIHQDIGKKVALKLIDKTMKESDLIVQRFRVEAKAAGAIQSEHIVNVFDVGADPRVGLYMVMEHLVGEDLQTRLEKDKRLDVKLTVMIAHQVARGLVKAHEAGVIHRDLKPANVFLTQRDNGQLLVKLLDFGVSKLLSDQGSGRITGAGAPIGTPLYMSPEQAEGKDDTDGRADIWSLGAVMYEALAGAPPFPDRGSYHGTIVGILTSRPKLLHDAAPWVPPELASVVDAMLVHDRSARIKDAAAVTQRLLEAYPHVLPDGTGRHTAVIVPQTSAAVDTTGDTEFFSSKDMPPGMASSRRSGAGAKPLLDDTDPMSASPHSQDEDSKRTVPNVATGPGVSSAATRTAAATPVEFGHDSEPEPVVPKSPKTDPMMWGAPNSSASGVSMPGTPPLIEPLPASVVPDTMRDDDLAVRADRRRWFGLAAVVFVIASAVAGGYFAGRRANDSTASPPPPSAPTATAATTAAPTASAPIAITTAPAPVASASAAPTPETSASAHKILRRRLPGVRPAGSEGEGPPKEAPPKNPYDNPPASSGIERNAPF
jgi:serine/threonine-protein kinase